MIRVFQAYEVSDGIDSIALTAVESWMVVGVYEAGRTTAETVLPNMTLTWAKREVRVLCILGRSVVVHVTAETAAELRKRLEEDAQPMRAQSAPITTEERA